MPRVVVRTAHGTGAAILFAVCGLVIPLNAQQPTAAQPGTKWSEAEIRQALAGVRAGRAMTPKQWPNGAKVAVCISFDVDNETWDLSRGATAPVSLSAGEYGAKSAMPRVLKLMDRHRIPGSFYIPAVAAMLDPSMIDAIKKAGHHEIAVHGWIHENLAALDDAAEEERLLTQSIDYLTKVTGRRPKGHRAPSWAFSRHTLPLLLKHGFTYDSSMMAMDEPYEIVRDGQPTGLVELPVEWILDDAPYFGRAGALPSPEMIFRVYQDEFDLAYQDGTMFMLTLHPQVIGHRSRINHLDKLITHIKSKPGVWFATAEQIAEYVKKSGSSY
jgi:peptidoglycan/xylan/chitin deacetylase (PgdA/CDA1 family)